MNDADVTLLCRVLAALTPQQQWDEFTADAWAEVLAPYDFAFEEARAAAAAIKRRQPYVDPHDLIAQVQRDRRPAAEAAHLATLFDRDALQASIEAADEAFMRKLAARRGSDRRLKAIPPPDYGGKDGTA
jgi:hypothetical protein